MKYLVIVVVFFAISLGLFSQSTAKSSETADVKVTVNSSMEVVRIVSDEPISKVRVINTSGDVITTGSESSLLGEDIVIPLARKDNSLMGEDIVIPLVIGDNSLMGEDIVIPIIKKKSDIYLVEITTKSGDVVVKTVVKD